MQKASLEEIEEFVRENRNNEGNFEKLTAKLEEAAGSQGINAVFQAGVDAVRSRADEYRKAKETGGTAWPEFEKFVSEFEKTVVEARKEAS